MVEQAVSALTRAIQDEMPRETWKAWPGGYTNVDEALVDAVFSIRARYGASPTTGVRGVVGRWREDRGEQGADDLRGLAAFHDRADALAAVLGSDQRLSRGRRSKAEALAEAADRLVGVGLVHRSDIETVDDAAGKRAYTGVSGLGWVTWEYFRMLLGVPGVKADIHICAFVTSAVGRPVDSRRAHDLVVAAADHLDVDSTHLDHAIWAHQRSRRPATR